MRHLSVIVLSVLLAGNIAGAADIDVVGLTSGKAVVSINGGKPRSMKAGEVSSEGVKLVSATSESAVFEIGGKRQTLSMGQSISFGKPSTAAQQATLTSDSVGQFVTTAQINGISVRFMVDTGATLVTLGSADAQRAGINYRSGQRATLQTANGTTTAYRVKIDSVRVGDIELTNVDGAVVEGKVMGELSLLGMSFLNRTDMKRSGDSLTLIRRF
ncbi:MAG TPA: TIGR02281 family clan AA aspartic protease [Burkholderiales bacterium]|nr:TIGR02281 family clan AA aspartic protease [Burkholderiales bacterium]